MKAIFYPDVPFATLMLPHIYQEIYFDRIYRHLYGKKDFVALDIGANIGEVTRFIQPVAKKIYAVEPSPLEFEALKQNKEYNGWDNVEVFNLAISSRNGETGFTVTDGNRTGSHLDLNGTIRVPTRTLATFLQENSIEHVDFLKLDVEGAERDIFMSEDFPADKIDSILCEFHDSAWTQLSKRLVQLGYHVETRQTAAIVCLFTK